MTISLWDLNAIVLCHTNRFFQAAAQVAHGWQDSDEELLSGALLLSANMLWARSEYEATDRQQARAMASSGAFLSAVSERAVAGLGGGARLAGGLLAALEQALRNDHDAILSGVMGHLQEVGLTDGPPGVVNRAVWQRLFPGFSYGPGQAQLCEEIQTRLAAA